MAIYYPPPQPQVPTPHVIQGIAPPPAVTAVQVADNRFLRWLCYGG